MFSNVFHPALSVPACADASGLRPRWLRARLADGSIRLLAPQVNRRQPRAGLADAFRCRCMLHFLDAGLRLDQASMALEHGVDRALPGTAPLPVFALRDVLDGVSIHVAPSDDEVPDMVRTASRGEPSGIVAPVVVALNLSFVLADTIELLGLNTVATSRSALPGGRANGGSRHPSTYLGNSAGETHSTSNQELAP